MLASASTQRGSVSKESPSCRPVGKDNGVRWSAVKGPAPKEITAERLRSGITAAGQIPGLRVLSPPHAVAAIRAATTDAPVEHVYLWASVAGMPDDLVERHMQLLCTEVRPNL